MARLREPRTGDVPKGYFRKRATGAEKIDYNVNKLATKAFAVPKPAKVPKAKKTATKKKGKKVSATYFALIKRALKKLIPKADHAGVSIPAIVKFLHKNYPEKSDRRYVRIALAKGVAAKRIVQTRQKFRLSAKEEKKSKTKKTTKKAAGTKRKASTKEGAKKTTTKKAKTTKKATTKKTTKKTTTKKAAKKTTTKKAPAKKTTKKSTATKASPKKSAPRKTPAMEGNIEESRGSIAEGTGTGKWQYYDNGWNDYYADASTIVEGVYQEYKQNPNIDVRAVKSGHFSYSIDFGTLQQTNVTTGTVRNIKRVLA